MMFKHVFVDAELAGAAEIHRDIPSHDLFDFSDPVIRRMRAVIHQLAFPEGFFVPGASVKRGNHREQVQSIWKRFFQEGVLRTSFRKVGHARNLCHLSIKVHDGALSVWLSFRHSLLLRFRIIAIRKHWFPDGLFGPYYNAMRSPTA